MTVPHRPAAPRGHGLRLLRAAVFAAVCVVLAAAGHTMASCASVPLWTLGAGFLAVLAAVLPLAGRERSLPGIAALLALGQTALHVVFGLGQHTSGRGTTMADGMIMPTSALNSAALNAGSLSGSSLTGTGTAAAHTTASLTDAELIAHAARLVCGSAAAALSPAHAYELLVDARIYDAVAAHKTAPAAASTALLPSLPMLLAHLLAALAAGWLLRNGDIALRRLAELSAHGVTEGALVRSLRGALALVRALLTGLPRTPAHGPRPPRADRLAPPALRHTALHHILIRRGPPAAAFALAA